MVNVCSIKALFDGRIDEDKMSFRHQCLLGGTGLAFGEDAGWVSRVKRNRTGVAGWALGKWGETQSLGI